MSESRTLISETANRVLGDLAGDDFSAAWAKAKNAELTQLLVSEADGGFGGDWDDAYAIAHLTGLHGAPLPLMEAILAAHLYATFKLGNIVPITLCTNCDGAVGGDTFTGILRRVPWGREADAIIAAAGDDLFIVSRHDGTLETGENIAGEPRDVLRFDRAPASSAENTGWDAARLTRTLAMIRAAQIGGALDAALDLTVTYARERKQFGRALAAFQAIQQQLAVLAEEAAAANMAAASAFHAADIHDAAFEMACAKLRANEAAQTGARIAHQVHGAMGFTKEYDLQRFTRRLWAWSSECGNDRPWAHAIGAKIAERGPDNFWADFVAR